MEKSAWMENIFIQQGLKMPIRRYWLESAPIRLISLQTEGRSLPPISVYLATTGADVSDYTTTLAVLMKNSGAWGNSGLRQETPDVLRTYMDAQPKEKLKDCLRIMNELTNQYGFQAAASAMEMACARGNINICDASVLAARITGYGITTPPETGPSLDIYDEAFLKGGSKAL